MTLKFFFSFLLYSSLVTISFAFQSKDYSLESKPSKFTVSNKSIHLHLNKTTYITGENIWFRAYIYDRNKNIISTSNHHLNVELFNQERKKIGNKVIPFIQGKSHGHFKLNDTIRSGNYYIRAFIPEMNTHRFDESFNKEIQILNLSETVFNKNTVFKNVKYDIQVLPEGGHLVNGILNTCGVKTLDQNGFSVIPHTMVLVDEENKVITNIHNNDFGHGKFSFVPNANKSYFVKIQINEKSFKQKLPKAKDKGIVMNINHNYKKNQVLLTINTNLDSSVLALKEKWNLVIRKDNQLREIAIEPKENTFQYNIALPYNVLFPGVNTVTLLNHQIPTIERQLFVYKNLNNIQFANSNLLKTEDSIEFNLSLKNNKTLKGNYSISILPKQTIANNNRETIYNSFLLKPYIKGHIENSNYYFQNISPKVKYDMDLLMLTQGWSKYKWEFLIKDDTNQDNIYGYSISGKIVHNQPKNKNLKVLFFSNENNLKLVDADQNNEFIFDNLKLTTGNEFGLTLINKKGKAVSAGFQYRIKTKNQRFVFPLIATINDTHINNNIIDFYEKIDETATPEKLDQVVITAKKLKREKLFPNFLSAKIDSSYYGYDTIRNFIQSVAQGLDIEDDNSFRSSTVNGQPYYPSAHHAIPMKYIDEIYYTPGKPPTRRLPEGKPPVVAIFLKDKLPVAKSLQNTKRFSILNAFNKTKAFYQPLYNSYISRDYNHFGTVWWFPEIQSNDKGNINFKIPNKDYSNVKLFIEGYTEKGNLISEIIDVNLKSNKVNSKLEQ